MSLSLLAATILVPILVAAAAMIWRLLHAAEPPAWGAIAATAILLTTVDLVLTAAVLIVRSGGHGGSPSDLLAYQYLLSLALFAVGPTLALVYVRVSRVSRAAPERARQHRRALKRAGACAALGWAAVVVWLAGQIAGWPPLFFAVRHGNTWLARQLLSLGASPLVQERYEGWFPLTLAVARDDLAMAALLLDFGASPNALDGRGRTALTLACWGHTGLARLLLERGGDPLLPDAHGQSSLMIAVVRGDAPLAHLLLARLAPFPEPSGANQRPDGRRVEHELVAALDRGDEAAVEVLLGRLQRRHTWSRARWERELLRAINLGDKEGAVRLLAVHGVDARVAALNGGSALLWAAQCGEEVVATRLLELGAAVDAPSGDGVTPLMEAARRGHPATARLLLGRGADPSRQTRKGWSALMFAAERGDLETVRILAAGRALLDARNSRGESALAVAVKNGRVAVAAELRARGAPE